MNKFKKAFLCVLFACLLVASVGILSACAQTQFTIDVDGLHEGQEFPTVHASKKGTITWLTEDNTLKAGRHNYTFRFEDKFGKKTERVVQIYATPHETDELSMVVIKQATCTENGIIKHFCKICKSDYDIESSPMLGHDFTVHSHVDGNCQVPGYIVSNCSRCSTPKLDENGDPFQKFDENLGNHVWQTDEFGNAIINRLTKEPNCQQVGEGYVKCEFCDAEKFTYITDGPHNYQKTDIELGTCVSFGTFKYKCTLCGEYEVDEDGNQIVHEDGVYGAHYYGKEGEQITVTIEHPTCQQGGLGHIECILCHAHYKEVELQQTEHHFVAPDYEEGDCHHYGYTQYLCAYECGTYKTDENGEKVKVPDEFIDENDHRFENGFCTVKYEDENGVSHVCGSADVDSAVVTFDIGANLRGLNPTDEVVAQLIPRDEVEDGNVYYDMFITGNGGVYQHFQSAEAFPWYSLDTINPNNAGLYYRDLVKTVVFDDGVTDLAKYMFQKFAQLEEVTLCSTLGGVARAQGPATIPAYCFADCKRLETINNMPQNVAVIDDYAFSMCSLLNLNNFGLPQNIQRIGKFAFQSNNKLLYVDFRGKTSLTEVGGNAFHNCANLAYVIVPASFRNVTIGGGCFLWTEAIIYVEDTYGTDWEDFDVYSTAYTYYLGNNSTEAFNQMVKLHSNALQVINNPDGYDITVSYLNVNNNPVRYTVSGNVITRAYRFTDQAVNPSEVRTLEQLYAQTLSNGTTFGENLQMFGPQAMAGTKIGNLTIPASVKVVCDAAFNSSTLTGLTIPQDSQLTTICHGAFTNMLDNGNLNLYLPHTLTYVAQSAFATTQFADVVIDMVNVPSGTYLSGSWLFAVAGGSNATFETLSFGQHVQTIGSYAFAGMSRVQGLTTLVIPNNVTSIGEGAFVNCSYLTNLTLPTGVVQIGKRAFEGTNCYTNSTSGGVTVIGNHLIKATGLTGSYTVAEGIVTLADEAFYGCTNLTVTLPTTIEHIGNLALEGVTIAGGDQNIYVNNQLVKAGHTEATFRIPYGTTKIHSGAVSGNTTITNLVLPTTLTEIGNNSFLDCTNLQSVTFVDEQGNEAPSSLQIIGNNAFDGCSKLANFEFGAQLQSIGMQSFRGCAFTSVTLPASLTQIPYGSFAACQNLVEFDTGNGVTTIDRFAFSACHALQIFCVGSNVVDINKYAFNSNKLQQLHIASLTNWVAITFSKDNAVSELSTTPDPYTNNPALGSNNLVDYYVGGALLQNLTIDSSISKVGAYAFANCKSLRTATWSFDDTVLGSRVFYRCYLMNTVNVSRAAWDEITDQAQLQTTVCGGIVPSYFGDGVNLTINFSKTDGTKHVIVSERTFNIYDSSLYTLTPLGADSNGNNQYALAINEGTVVIPGECLKDYRTVIDGYVTQLTLPSTVVEIEPNAFDGGGEHALNGLLWRIVKIEITDTDQNPSQLKKIGKRAFFGAACATFNMPASVTFVDQEAFGASSIGSVIIKDVNAWCSIQFTQVPGLTSSWSGYTSNPLALGETDLYLLGANGALTLVEEIEVTANQVGSYAFYNYQGLKKVTLTTNVASVGHSAFAYCNNLSEVYVETNNATRYLALGNFSFDRSEATPLTFFIEQDKSLLQIDWIYSNGSTNNSTYSGAIKKTYTKDQQNG